MTLFQRIFHIRPAKTGTNGKFSEFIRNASSGEKKRVYSIVLRRATERQQEVMSRTAK